MEYNGFPKNLANVLSCVNENSKTELIVKISELLSEIYSHSPSYFFQILYRIDLDENKVTQLLSEQNELTFKKIATLVVQRQLEKRRIKEKIKQNPDWDFDI